MPVAVLYFGDMQAPKKNRIDTIEKLAGLTVEGFAELRQDMDKRFEQVDSRLDGIDKRLDRTDTRFDAIDATLENIHARLRHIENELVDIHRRLDRLDEQGASNAGFAKEIDALMARVATIERELNIQPPQ